MKNKQTSTVQMCLTILYRIEPGCLGPDGIDHVELFSQIAQRYFNKKSVQGINWLIVPRYDKSLKELQYSVAGKKLDEIQADKILDAFELSLEEVVENFQDKLPELIDQYIAANKTKK